MSDLPRCTSFLHRHEPPVFGKIEYVGETENLFAVCKPPSMPMHPSGAYRHNSLEFILKNDPIIEKQPSFHLVHRLDRVTSGLVVLAKNKVIAAKISQEIRDKSTKKVNHLFLNSHSTLTFIACTICRNISRG